jgi:hypothetical protein
VLKIVYGGAPPPTDLAGPASQTLDIAVDILARRAATGTGTGTGTGGAFSPLADGAPLASETDDYQLVVRPKATGFLYLFEIDSMGAVTWLFPRNAISKLSSGQNPVGPADVVRVPSAEDRALFLDATLGVEHVYAVFSAAAWPELADALGRAAAASAPSAPAPAGGAGFAQGLIQMPNGIGGYRQRTGNGGASSDDDLLPPSQLPYAGSASRRPAGQRPTGRSTRSSDHLVVERWFRHVAPAQGIE